MDLSSKRVLVTGGASGIGAETVRAMAAKGAQVIIAARNLDAAGEVKESVVATTGNENIDVMFLELGSLAKIRASAAEFLARYESLDILINNAGIMACPHGQTEDGFELQFGSNHIGHFYFTQKLMPALLKALMDRKKLLNSRSPKSSNSPPGQNKNKASAPAASMPMLHRITRPRVPRLPRMLPRFTKSSITSC